MKLNIEEMYLLAMYDTTSRIMAIRDIKTTLPYIQDKDMHDLCVHVMVKLENMTDEEFRELDFSFAEKEEAHG